MRNYPVLLVEWSQVRMPSKSWVQLRFDCPVRANVIEFFIGIFKNFSVVAQSLELIGPSNAIDSPSF